MTAVLKAVEREPDETLIERLEGLLAQAKSGELVAFGYGAVTLAGTIQTAIVCPAGVNEATMLGALSRVLLRYNAVTFEN